MFGSSVSIEQVSYESYANKSPIYVSLINVQVNPQSKTKWISQALKEGLIVFQIQGVGLRVFYRQLGRRM